MFQEGNSNPPEEGRIPDELGVQWAARVDHSRSGVYSFPAGGGSWPALLLKAQDLDGYLNTSDKRTIEEVNASSTRR